MDLSKLSDQDLEALASGDFTKVSDEALQNLAQPQQAQEKMEPTPYTGRAGWDDTQIPGPENSAEAREQLANLPSQIADTALMVAPSPANPFVRAGVNGVGSALAEYLKPGSSVGDALTAGGVSSGLSFGGSGLSSLARGSANRAMKRAIGVTGAKSKTAPPDLGNRLVDEGVIGTKARMAEQVGEKYGKVEDEIQGLARDLPGSVSGDKLAQAVEGRTARHLFPSSGTTLPGHKADVDAIAARAQELRGIQPGTTDPVKSYGAQDLLSLKRGGDFEGFTNASTPASSTAAEIGRTQANAARAGLEDISSGSMSQALKREQALLLADRGLNATDMTYKNPVSFTDMATGLAGVASHGVPGAALGILASKALATPLGQSLWAHGAQRGVAPAADAVSRFAPQETAALQSLFSNESQR